MIAQARRASEPWESRPPDTLPKSSSLDSLLLVRMVSLQSAPGSRPPPATHSSRPTRSPPSHPPDRNLAGRSSPGFGSVPFDWSGGMTPAACVHQRFLDEVVSPDLRPLRLDAASPDRRLYPAGFGERLEAARPSRRRRRGGLGLFNERMD